MASVRIKDVTPRLVFQAQPGTTAQKVELVERLMAAGVTQVEVSSFVNPKLVPGLADAEQVFAQIRRREGVSLHCCIGNVSGLKRAIDSGAHGAWFLLAADEEFAKANIGRSIDESLAELARMREVAARSDILLGTYLIGAFGGPTGLARGPDSVRPVAERLVELGINDWILADSFGYAAPPQMREMIEFAAGLTSLDRLTVQVHDSRGMGVANVAELARIGVANIDTSLTGAGGHPAVTRGRGVGCVCTEDSVQLLERMGIDTGIDLSALLETANWLDGLLGGREWGFTRHVGKVPMNAADVEAARANRGAFRWSGK